MSRLGRMFAAPCPSLPASSASGGSSKRSLSTQAGLTAKSSAGLGSKSTSSNSGKRLGQPSSQCQSAKRHRISIGCTKVDVQYADDNVNETEKEHSLRHPSFVNDCARCGYRRHSKSWHRMASLSLTARRSVSWLAPKPSSMGGQWGLGCLVCAAALAETSGSKKKALLKGGAGWRQANLRAGKWARFSVTRLCGFRQSAAAILNHMASGYHRKAVAKWQAAQVVDNTALQTASPPMTASSDAILPKGAQAGLTAVPVVVDEPEDIESTALLKGRVPQLQDWVDAWASIRSRSASGRFVSLRQA